MGQESDDIVSLPAPPPPNPAARRAAIDTAMRKFDGIEKPARRPARLSPWQWASSHRRATGGLVTAALIAAVGIPAIQVALRNQPQDIASERAEPSFPTADVQAIDDNAAAAAALPAEPTPEQAAAVPMARNEPAAAPEEARALAKQEQLGFTDSRPEQKARAATTAPLLSAPASPMASVAPAPPPPAPPPPPPPP